MNTLLKSIMLATTITLGVGIAAQADIIIDSTFPANGNGGFELNGAGGFLGGGNQTDNSINWSSGDTTSLGATYAITEVFAANNIASAGAYSAVLNEDAGRGLIQNTGFNLDGNYTFNLEFDWVDETNWGVNDEVEVRLFTSSDDTITGTLTPLYTAAFTKTIDATYTTESVTGSLPGSIGSSRDLWISFSANGNNTFDFARVDEVNLELISAVPEPSSLALLMIGTLALFSCRRFYT